MNKKLVKELNVSEMIKIAKVRTQHEINGITLLEGDVITQRYTDTTFQVLLMGNWVDAESLYFELIEPIHIFA